MSVSSIIKGTILMAAGLIVVPIVDWMEKRKDKERLRFINRRRALEGKPLLRSLWQYEKEYDGERHPR
jgi:hypothetical protein